MSISRKFLFLHDIQLSSFTWNLIHRDSEKLFCFFYILTHISLPRSERSESPQNSFLYWSALWNSWGVMKKHHHNFFYFSVRTLNSILHLRKICVRIIHTVSFSVFQETDRARHRAGLLQSRPPVKQHRIELKNQNRRRGSAAYSLTGKRIFFSEHKKSAWQQTDAYLYWPLLQFTENEEFMSFLIE